MKRVKISIFRRRIAVAAIIVAAVGGLTACGDDTQLSGNLSVVTDTLTAYALTGTSAVLPSALNIPFGVVVRADGAINNGVSYDVVFDIDQAGKAVLYPIRMIVNPLAGTHRVGIVKATQSFDALKRAPTVVYPDTLAVTLAAGEVAVAETGRNSSGDVCQFQISPNIYAKIIVDSVNTTQRTVHFRMVLNPNCGIRSFESASTN